jgi:hypothetical protein
MPLVAARSGQRPLAHGLFTVLDREADGYKGGRCGKERPAVKGGGRRGAPEDREEQGFSLHTGESIR